MRIRIGNGFDVHKFCEGDSITLGGIKISHDRGLEAHSDGDVLIHSLCDALLGALSLGDIGSHFPDTDPLYSGIDSRILLKRCCDEVDKRGYIIGNVDNTVLAQSPKLRDHIDLMRNELSRVMELDLEDVSIKATTTEHLGFVGRKEGIAVFTSVLLYKK